MPCIAWGAAGPWAAAASRAAAPRAATSWAVTAASTARATRPRHASRDGHSMSTRERPDALLHYDRPALDARPRAHKNALNPTTLICEYFTPAGNARTRMASNVRRAMQECGHATNKSMGTATGGLRRDAEVKTMTKERRLMRGRWVPWFDDATQGAGMWTRRHRASPRPPRPPRRLACGWGCDALPATPGLALCHI